MFGFDFVICAGIYLHIQNISCDLFFYFSVASLFSIIKLFYFLQNMVVGV